MIKPENFKDHKVEVRSKYLNPFVHRVMEEMLLWLTDKKVKPVVTETVTTLLEDAKVNRKSNTHRQGRAFDIRTRDWPRSLVKEFKDHFNKKYGKLGALGATTLQPTFILWHDSGHGEHMHVQFSSEYLVVLSSKLDPQPETTPANQTTKPEKA